MFIKCETWTKLRNCEVQVSFSCKGLQPTIWYRLHRDFILQSFDLKQFEWWSHWRQRWRCICIKRMSAQHIWILILPTKYTWLNQICFSVKRISTMCWNSKAIYGLKQAGCEWNSSLDKVFNQIGFTKCVGDTCLQSV